MTAERILAKLEGALSPKAATLLWLAEAHQFGSLPAYVGWLLDQPVEAAPLWRVPEQAETVIRAAMRGEPREAVRQAVRQTIRHGGLGDPPRRYGPPFPKTIQGWYSVSVRTRTGKPIAAQ